MKLIFHRTEIQVASKVGAKTYTVQVWNNTVVITVSSVKHLQLKCAENFSHVYIIESQESSAIAAALSSRIGI